MSPFLRSERLKSISGCWRSQGDTLKKLIIKKNKAYLLFKKCPNVTNEVLYRQYRSKVNSQMRLAERKYYQNMPGNNKFNLKKTWQILKDIIGKSKPGNISNKCLVDGTIYINIGSNLAGKIKPNNPYINPTSYIKIMLKITF